MSKKVVADVAVWGRIPPPIGGMAVHLRRLLPYLAEAGIAVQMYSVGRRTPEHPQVRQVSDSRLSWMIGLLFGSCEPVHYVFSDNTSARFAASLLALFGKAKVILRIGGESLEVACNSPSYLERQIIRFAIRHATAIVGVNERICALAERMGAGRVLHIPGFIPEGGTETALPAEVEAFITRNDIPVMLASGEVRAIELGDLYGPFALLELLERISNLRLVFYAYQITLDRDGQNELEREISRRGLQERFLLFPSTVGLMPAMARCDFMIRPTLSDGDSNAVREALHLGLPVLASDCVERPAGVSTYAVGNLESMQQAVMGMLANLETRRQELKARPKPDNAGRVVELMLELLGRPREKSPGDGR